MLSIRVPKSSCPFIGIPVEGQRPFVVDANKLRIVTKGINITDTVIESGTPRTLTITHRTGRVHGRFTFLDQGNKPDYKLRVWNWAESERKKRNRPVPTVPLLPPKVAVVIRRLERELKNCSPYEAPRSPLLPKLYSYSGVNWYEQRESIMREQREKRKITAKVAGWVLKNHMTATTAYQWLRLNGFEVKLWGQVTQSQRQRAGISSQGEYWRKLWQFCGLTVERSHREPVDFAQELMEHAEARTRFILDRRERLALQSQIATLKEIYQGTNNA